MENHLIQVRENGLHGHEELRDQLQVICYDYNFELLEGAKRLECLVSYGNDDYAGFRHNNTEFKWSDGLVNAGGHDTPEYNYASAAELSRCYEDLKELFDAAAMDIPKPFEIRVEKVYPPLTE